MAFPCSSWDASSPKLLFELACHYLGFILQLKLHMSVGSSYNRGGRIINAPARRMSPSTIWKIFEWGSQDAKYMYCKMCFQTPYGTSSTFVNHLSVIAKISNELKEFLLLKIFRRPQKLKACANSRSLRKYSLRFVLLASIRSYSSETITRFTFATKGRISIRAFLISGRTISNKISRCLGRYRVDKAGRGLEDLWFVIKYTYSTFSNGVVSSHGCIYSETRQRINQVT